MNLNATYMQTVWLRVLCLALERGATMDDAIKDADTAYKEFIARKMNNGIPPKRPKRATNIDNVMLDLSISIAGKEMIVEWMGRHRDELVEYLSREPQAG